MVRISSTAAWLLALLALSVLVSTFEPAPSGSNATPAAVGSADEQGELLRGTWLREYVDHGFRVRRILALAADGSFRETVRALDEAGLATAYVHEGTWLFDGTNLKRKYTLVNGRPPSRLNLPFATFQIAFETRNEFLGVDHIHRNQIRYRRVPPETQP